MAYYHITKCPHCHVIISSSANNTKYGSPFRRCPYCLQPYVDKSYEEVALTGESSKLWILLMLTGVLTIVFMLVTHIYNGYLLVLAIGSLFLGFPLMFAYWSAPENQPDYLKELAASERRLSDPTYARKLQELGYNVPEKYLKSSNKNKYSDKAQKNETLFSKNNAEKSTSSIVPSSSSIDERTIKGENENQESEEDEENDNYEEYEDEEYEEDEELNIVTKYDPIYDPDEYPFCDPMEELKHLLEHEDTYMSDEKSEEKPLDKSKGENSLQLYCRKCGKKIQSDSLFCPYCGTKI